MKLYKRKIRVFDEIDRLQCDLCGIKSLAGNNWSTKPYEVNETTIQQREGQQYPECGSGTKYEIDLCPKCFKERFLLWLKMDGANIEEKEWSW